MCIVLYLCVIPGTSTNSESVSPYTTLHPHFFVASTNLMALSNVSRPLLTTLSPTSTHGILPLKLAAVYPYVTLAISLRPSCRECSTRCSNLSFLYNFIDCLTIRRVSRISRSIRGKTPSRTDDFTKTAPQGEILIKFLLLNCCSMAGDTRSWDAPNSNGSDL